MPDVVVHLPGALAAYADGSRDVVVAVPAAEPDLRSVLGALAERHPGVVARTLDERGGLRRHINVFVGTDNARDLDGLATRVPAGSTVSIIPAISGGALDHVAAVEREGADLSKAATDLTAPVASCPGWDVRALVVHVGALHRRVARIVRERPAERPPWPYPEPDRREDVLGWFDAGLADLAAALRDAPADAPAWNWSGADPRAGWWARRMAHETAVHRWDAQAATGEPAPVDAELAVDGIDEALAVHLPDDLAKEPVPRGPHGTAHVHCTDAAGEWLVTLRADGADVRREHAKGAAAVRGPASDLFLALWGRVPFAPPLETFGDPALLDRLRTG